VRILIDESGDTGRKGSRYFVMAAVMVSRTKSLSSASRAVGSSHTERKFYNSSDEIRVNVLTEVSLSRATIVYMCVDKYDHNSIFYNLYGNELYKETLSMLLESVLKKSTSNDVSISIDDTSSIKKEELIEISTVISNKYGRNLKRCEKRVSCTDNVFKLQILPWEL
jgi:hypothetical protein